MQFMFIKNEKYLLTIVLFSNTLAFHFILLFLGTIYWVLEAKRNMCFVNYTNECYIYSRMLLVFFMTAQ